MLKGLTSTFKNGCNNVEVMYREYLVLGNQTIPIKAELSDDSYENGNFIGTFIFKTIKFETDAQYDFKNKEFEYYKEVNGESIKIGTFITTEVEINDTTEIVKVVGMDYGLKTQVAYKSQLDYSAGNITLLDVWNEACQLSGLESGIDYFPNGDFIVDNDQFTGTGATIRDVFKGIAMSSGSFVKVMNDDKVYLVFNSYTGDTETTTISGSGSVNDGYAIDNLQIEGKAEQEGTPTPDNPEEIKTVSGIGNLFDISTQPSYRNGSTATSTDDYIRITNMNPNSTFYYVVYKLLDVSNYVGKTFSVKMNFVASASNKGNYIIGLCDENGSNRIIGKTASSVSGTILTYTIPTLTTSTYLAIWLYANNGGTSNAGDYVDYTNIQVEMSDTIHTPVPYGHWLPIKVENKNLFDGILTTGYWNRNEKTLSGTTNEKYKSFSLSLKQGIYTLSSDININIIRAFTDYDYSSNIIFGGTINNIISYTMNITEDTILYITIQRNDNTNWDSTSKVQLEKSSTATEYIEHQEQTTLIDLNKYDENNNIVGYYELCSTKDGSVKDLLNIKNGSATIAKNMLKKVLDGSESWNLWPGSLTNVERFYTNIDNADIQYSICDKFTYTTSNLDNEHYRSSTLGGQRKQFVIYINKSRLSSVNVNGLKSWLSSNNVKLYYKLYEPQTITLNGTYDINLYEGVNHISIEDELEPTMVMSYYKDNLDIIEDYVELEDKRDTRPWTCLRLGMSQVEGENVDYVDEDLVAKYGENWLILNDNPFAYTQQKRQQLITNIFNRIKEFGYSAFVSKTSFKPYLTAGDIVKFKNREGNLVKTILLRYNHNAEEITLESPSETSATVNYVYPLTDIDLYKRTEIQVDKANNQIRTNVDNIGLLQTSSSSNADNINTLTSLVDGQGKEIERLGTKIVQDVGSINASVTAIQGEIEQGVGLVKTTSVTIDDNGLSVSTDTSKIQTTMTNDTFKITDKGGTELAKFGYDENEGISTAEMDNLTVKNYFIAGVHRVETIEIDGEKRTGWFYMED